MQSKFGFENPFFERVLLTCSFRNADIDTEMQAMIDKERLESVETLKTVEDRILKQLIPKYNTFMTCT